MIDDSLAPDEVRGLRRWRAMYHVAHHTFLVGVVVLMFVLSLGAWLAVGLPVAAGLLVLHARCCRCPRCRGSVFGRRDVDDNTHWDGDPAVLWAALPLRCRGCGVGLSGQAADAEPGAAADGGDT